MDDNLKAKLVEIGELIRKALDHVNEGSAGASIAWTLEPEEAMELHEPLLAAFEGIRKLVQDT